jgi:2-polyprenyl-3-methyl-5-hydroxy-6-metoxy-1,4-benzoquinol methylase
VTPYIDYRYSTAGSEASHEYLAPALLALLREVSREASLLDLGCGNGSLTAIAAPGGRKVVGVDLSASGIALARECHPGILFLEGDVCGDLPPDLQRESFDVVTCFEVIEHVYAPRVLLANCRRALKPGGALILSTPYHGYWKNLALAVTGKLDDHFTALWDGGHIKFWSRGTLAQLLEEAGFRVERFVGVGRLPFLWKSMIVRSCKL